MNRVIEISWFGKAGQGVVTASGAMASVLASDGQYVQSMVEYSLPRKGVPVRAFNRISKNPIRNHSYIVYPDIVAVTDASLLVHSNIVQEQKEEVSFFINSSRDISYIRNKVDFRDRSLFVVDADKISLQEIGVMIPGISVLSLIVKYLNLISPVAFKEKLREFLSEKFSRDLVEENLAIVERSLEEGELD